jgi:hypothetical protein
MQSLARKANWQWKLKPMVLMLARRQPRVRRSLNRPRRQFPHRQKKNFFR